MIKFKFSLNFPCIFLFFSLKFFPPGSGSSRENKWGSMRIRIHSPGLHQANSPILVVELSGCWLSRATCGRTWWSPGTRWPPPTSGWVTGPRTSCRYSYRVTLVLVGSGFDFHFDVIRIWDMPVPISPVSVYKIQ